MKRSAVAAAGVAAPMIVPSSALGLGSRPAPSNRIVVGSIGLGGMGRGDMKGMFTNEACQVVAACDADMNRAREGQVAVIEHYAAQTAIGKYDGCAVYDDFREVLARGDLDAVTIATPDHWHTIPVIAAARAGLDIHCQKPLSLTIDEGKRMVDAVTQYGVVFQTGSQQRSQRNFRYACELVRNGRIGNLHTVRVGIPCGKKVCPPQPEMPIPDGLNYDMWLGPAPEAPYNDKRLHYQWRWISDYSGGQITDWAGHHCDIAQWGMGYERGGPIEVAGKGKRPQDGLYTTFNEYEFECLYGNGVKMIVSSAAPESGVRFEGDDGWVFVGRHRIDAHRKDLLSSVIGPNEIHLYESKNHRQNFVDCIKSRAETVAPVEIGHRSISIGHLGVIAMHLQRKLKWDPKEERFVDDPEADRWLSRSMRSPWSLETL